MLKSLHRSLIAFAGIAIAATLAACGSDVKPIGGDIAPQSRILAAPDSPALAPQSGDTARMNSVYVFEALKSDGSLRWTETVHNVVVNEGLDQLLDKTFKGSSYTAAWYCGLVDNANFGAINNDDTAARITTSAPSYPTTNNWRESTAYSNANRPTLTLGTVSSQSVNNSASKCSFTINATATINGAFTVTNNTKGGTSGSLYSVTSFGATRSVLNGDTLNVTITLNTSR